MQLHLVSLCSQHHACLAVVFFLLSLYLSHEHCLFRFIYNHPVPVVLGPRAKHYLIDHHHLTRALHELGIKQCYAGRCGNVCVCVEHQAVLCVQMQP